MAQVKPFFPSAEGERRDYSVMFKFKDSALTGVCIIKCVDNVLIGTIVNEFGIKAMDFTVTADSRKVRLVNVLPVLDKWYIRKIVKADFKYMFSNSDRGELRLSDKKRSITVDGNSMKMCNQRYSITYLFGLMDMKTQSEGNYDIEE